MYLHKHNYQDQPITDGAALGPGRKLSINTTRNKDLFIIALATKFPTTDKKFR